jgi:hypothetical protein
MMTSGMTRMSHDERGELRARNQKLIRKYMGETDGPAWWEPGAFEAGYFAEDFLYEIPNAHSIPGMPITYRGDDIAEFFRYLNSATMSGGWRPIWHVIHDGADPSIFWMEFYGEGEAQWRGTGESSPYNQLEITYVELDENGKLKRYREHFNPTLLFESAGETIHGFDYNEDRLRSGLSPHIVPLDTQLDYAKRRMAQDPKDLVDTSSLTDDEIRDLRVRNRRLIEMYQGDNPEGLAWWDAGAREAGWFADDYSFEIPQMTKGAARTYRGEDAQVFHDWLHRTVMRFDVLFQHVHEMADPYTFWFEFYGEGSMTWGKGGSYYQLEISFARLDKDGKFLRYREHFDPVRILETTGAWKPVEYNYHDARERLGLPPHHMKEDTLQEYVARRIAEQRGVNALVTS